MGWRDAYSASRNKDSDQIGPKAENSYVDSLGSPTRSTAIFMRSEALRADFRISQFQRDYCYGMTGSMYQYEGKIAQNHLFFRDKVPKNRVSSKKLIFGDFSPRVQNPLKF